MGLFNQCPVCKASFVGRVCLACSGGPAEEASAGDLSVLAPGDSFRGLEIIEVLQAGGMGVLYRALDSATDREVVLKLMRPDKVLEADLEPRFERETKALGLLQHPNIVALLDSGKEGEDLFFTIEFVQGRNLGAFLADGVPGLRETLRIGSEICDALQFAHDKGVIHRDIKPDNILLDADARVKVADFGLAKLQGESKESLALTMSGAVLGTQSYMAPEQGMDSAGVDHRADIFSVGIVLYQMLTGKLPRGKLVPPSETEGVVKLLDAIVLKATAMDPGNRHQKMSDLARELRGVKVESAVSTVVRGRPVARKESKSTTESYIPPPEEVQPWLEDSERRLKQYVLVSNIGSGGMGSVWKAWDTKLARWVAIKILTPGDETGIRRFEREAQLAAQLRHPNIASIYEVNQENEINYLVMDYVDGGCIHETPLLVKEMVRAYVKVCRAVQFAHDRKIIHRDIKPANILLGTNGEPYVTDFGLAKILETDSSLSTTGTILGTPVFMPPEQAQGDSESIDARSDVYCLGATLYSLLVGVPPFSGDNTAAVLHKIIYADPVPPRKIQPQVPEAVEAISLKAMEKEKERRYPTAGAMAEDLERFLGDEIVAASTQGTLVRLYRRVRRNPLPYVGMISLLVAVGVIGFILIFMRPSPPALKEREIPVQVADPPAEDGPPQEVQVWKKRFELIKPRLAFFGFRKYSEGLVRNGKLLLEGIPASLSGSTVAWFDEQASHLIPGGVWPKKEWLSRRAEAEKASAWCGMILSILPETGGDFGRVREKVKGAAGLLDPVLVYRGTIDLSFSASPWAEIRSLRSGSEWIVRDGKKIDSSAEWSGDSLVTPVGLRHLEIGEYTVVLFHPELGEKTFSLTSEGLENGGSYVCSGSLRKKDSFRIHPLR